MEQGVIIYGKCNGAMSDSDIGGSDAKSHRKLASGEEWQRALNNREK